MTTITAPTTTAATTTGASAAGTGFGALGEKDFLAMLTAELKQQDPTEPVDQKAMLAQMAQFTSLAGINTTNTTLSAIAGKLDTLIAAQNGATIDPATTGISGN